MFGIRKNRYNTEEDIESRKVIQYKALITMTNNETFTIITRWVRQGTGVDNLLISLVSQGSITVDGVSYNTKLILKASYIPIKTGLISISAKECLNGYSGGLSSQWVWRNRFDNDEVENIEPISNEQPSLVLNKKGDKDE